jgi:hypothetical protein
MSKNRILVTAMLGILRSLLISPASSALTNQKPLKPKKKWGRTEEDSAAITRAHEKRKRKSAKRVSGLSQQGK